MNGEPTVAIAVAIVIVIDQLSQVFACFKNIYNKSI